MGPRLNSARQAVRGVIGIQEIVARSVNKHLKVTSNKALGIDPP